MIVFCRKFFEKLGRESRGKKGGKNISPVGYNHKTTGPLALQEESNTQLVNDYLVCGEYQTSCM